jgi:hypothetical protein
MLKKSETTFDARKNFFDLKVVQITFYFFTSTSLICFFFILLNSNLEWDLSYVGFNKFIEIYKVPIALLALNIPFIAILGAFHKSEQTRVQIKASEGQNIFANYYKHLEEFTKHVDNYSSDENFKCDVRRLHKLFYPDSSRGDYELSDYCIKKIRVLVSSARFRIKPFFDIDIKVDDKASEIMERSFNKLFAKHYPDIYDFLLSTGFRYRDEALSKGDSYKFFTLYSTMVCFHLKSLDFLRHVLAFDSSDKISPRIHTTLNSINYVYFEKEIKNLILSDQGIYGEVTNFEGYEMLNIINMKFSKILYNSIKFKIKYPLTGTLPLRHKSPYT